jgi:hypothetical protein
MYDGRMEPAEPAVPSPAICDRCGYELSDLDRCPECGLTAAEAAPFAWRRRMLRDRARAAAIALVILLGVPLVFVLLLSVWFLTPNLGLPFGYYGRFNRTVAAIDNVPGLTVLSARGHEDVFLEEIDVTAQLATGESVRIFLPQDVQLRSAYGLVICTMDGAPMASTDEWSGIMVTLGPRGTLAQATDGKVTSVVELLGQIDLVRQWIEAAPPDDFTKLEVGGRYSGAVRIWIE